MIKKKELVKDEDENISMTQKNIQICISNSQRYATPQLNTALELHYCGFSNINNLKPFININTIYLNNNIIQKIENLQCPSLVTVNLSNNRISKIQGLSELKQLKILDISCNRIEKIQNMANLIVLENLNISQNKFSSPESIQNLIQTPNITSLNLRNNPLPPDPAIYNTLGKLQKLLTLFMKDTQFNRGMRNYRKQTIFSLKSLTYLDQSPITVNERKLIQAWKQGGIKQQRETRKLLQFETREKQKRDYEEIIQRNEKVEKLRQQLYEKQAAAEIKELEQWQAVKREINEDNFYEMRKANLNIQQLKLYLSIYRQSINYRTVGEVEEIPKCIDANEQGDTIFVYGVKPQQIPKIKQAYYPEQTRPIVAKDYGNRKKQTRWIQQYEYILEDIAVNFKRDLQLVVPAFNLKIHEFDEQSKREPKRFSRQEVLKKMIPESDGKIQYNMPLEDPTDDLNQLD